MLAAEMAEPDPECPFRALRMDSLPEWEDCPFLRVDPEEPPAEDMIDVGDLPGARKSTRLNSSHSENSYAVVCLKKKHDTSSVAVDVI